jgi:hypothetical protein
MTSDIEQIARCPQMISERWLRGWFQGEELSRLLKNEMMENLKKVSPLVVGEAC